MLNKDNGLHGHAILTVLLSAWYNKASDKGKISKNEEISMKIKVFDSELRIMQILWENGEMNARQIAYILEDEIGWNVNTTYTTIKKLVAKGAVERRSPKFMCIPLIKKEDVQKQEARELSSKLFGGSASALLSTFLSDKSISKNEINQMRQLVEMLDDSEE